MTLTSNDARGALNINLKGDPYNPPILGSLTDTVAVTLNYGDSTTQTLNIANQAASGAADLEFELGIQINASSVTNSGTYDDDRASLNLAEANYADQRLIVKFQPGLSSQSQTELREELGAEVLKSYRRTGIELWSVEDMTVEEAIGNYGDDPRILYIEPDFIVETIGDPNDSRFDELWGMHNTGQTGGTDDADIDAQEAWDITTGSDNIVVGIIDTGIDYDHEDLRDNMWKNPGEIADNGIDDDGNGYIDDVYGWDFVNEDNDPFDGHSHGTHVAGTVGARGNNGTGVAGVSWRTQLMALKFLSDFGSGYTSDAIEAVEYAVNNGAHLTNNSWGGGSFSQALKDAISEAHQANQLFVAAAGNSRSNNDTRPMYPASYDVDNIISVAATDHNDELAYFSSYGLTTVDLGAPGVSVLSSIPNNGYSSFNGTSMASPHVAGAIALTWSQAPFLTGMQMKAIVMEQVDPIPALANNTVTGGRLNVLNMVQNTIGWIAT
ncbi:subtilisin-like serine protease, partial [Moorena producens 3L]